MNFDFLKIGTRVQLERGGPDKLVGELLEIHPDYIVLRTEDGRVMYCTVQHIKTITEHVETEPGPQSGDLAPEVPATKKRARTGKTEVPIKATDFHDLLTKLKFCRVQVNHGGPNVLIGVLVKVGPDAITLLHDMKERVHYPIFHIRSISRANKVVNADDGKHPHKPPKGKTVRFRDGMTVLRVWGNRQIGLTGPAGTKSGSKRASRAHA